MCSKSHMILLMCTFRQRAYLATGVIYVARFVIVSESWNSASYLVFCFRLSIGSWAANPNSAANKNYFFQVVRASSAGTGPTQGTTATGMGPIGYLTNGNSN